MRFTTHRYLSLALLSWVAVVRSQNCQLQVPNNPLTAQGLATPYILTGCNQIDFANEGVFVEAAILDPATGAIQIYNPLVINAGMTPVGGTSPGSATGAGPTSSIPATANPATTTSATDTSSVPSLTTSSARPRHTKGARQAAPSGFYVTPIVPTLPNNAIVGIWFGSNANSVTLTGDTGGCVNGLGTSVFGQFAYCNGQAWFNAAKSAVAQGLIKLTPPGTGSGGQACPTTHDFRIVDQDQSDNVLTTYLLINNNTLSQNTPTASKANPDAEVLSNASDNALVTEFIDPSLGCSPFQNPCTTCPTGQSPALATDELLANYFPPAGGPALIPLNDPMVLVNGQQSLQKVNLYRDGTGQPQANNQNASGLTYCQQITQGGIFINQNQQQFTNAGSPATNQATNLFTFLAMRFSASFGPAPGLGCTGLLNVANPVSLTMDGNGIVTAATIDVQLLEQLLSGASGGASTGLPASQTGNPTTSVGASTGLPASQTGTSTTFVGASTGPPASQTGTPTTSVGASTGLPASQTGTPTTSVGASTGLPASQTGTPTTSVGSITGTATETGVRLHPTTSALTTSVPATTSVVGSFTQVPTGIPNPTCSGVPTVTVTVTACSANSTAPTSTATSGRGHNHGRGGNHWKRSDHLHRKRRIESYV